MGNIVLVGQNLAMLSATFLIILVAQLIYYKASPYCIREQLKEGNIASALPLAGYFLSVIAIIAASSVGPTLGLVADLQSKAIYSALGIVLLIISKFLNDKIILHKFCIKKEIIEDKNPGTGAVVFGTFIASGLIIAGSIIGEGGGVVSALAFFAMGQLALIIFSKLYNLITKHDVHEEIEKDNIAAGVSLAGAMIAFGIILFKGVAGNFTGWYVDSINFTGEILAGFILLPVFRILFDKVLIPKIDLDDEVKKGNLAVGFLEAVVLISVAVIYLFVADFTLI